MRQQTSPTPSTLRSAGAGGSTGRSRSVFPDKKGRLEIFQVHTRGVPLAKDVDIAALAETTFGFVGADIALLVKEAAMNAIRKIIPLIDIDKEIPNEVIDQLKLTKSDFDAARKIVQPSALREVLIEVPDVPWEDIAGLDETKDTFIKIIEGPVALSPNLRKTKLQTPEGHPALWPAGDGKDPACKRHREQTPAQFHIGKRARTALKRGGRFREACAGSVPEGPAVCALHHLL